MTHDDPASHSFIVVYLASGYHQIKIPKDDGHLYCFLMKDGVYRYGRQPIGFMNTGHRFVNKVTRLIAHIDVIMEVDNALVEGRYELTSRLTHLLEPLTLK